MAPYSAFADPAPAARRACPRRPSADPWARVRQGWQAEAPSQGSGSHINPPSEGHVVAGGVRAPGRLAGRAADATAELPPPWQLSPRGGRILSSLGRRAATHLATEKARESGASESPRPGPATGVILWRSLSPAARYARPRPPRIRRGAQASHAKVIPSTPRARAVPLWARLRGFKANPLTPSMAGSATWLATRDLATSSPSATAALPS